MLPGLTVLVQARPAMAGLFRWMRQVSRLIETVGSDCKMSETNQGVSEDSPGSSLGAPARSNLAGVFSFEIRPPGNSQKGT